MSKFLSYEDRMIIAQRLQENASFGTIGKELGKDRTTIAKEIKKYSYDKKSGRPGYPYNPCKFRATCKAKKICGTSCTHQSAYKCSLCSECTLHCSDFVEDVCSVKSKPPYVCNGCSQLPKCSVFMIQQMHMREHIILFRKPEPVSCSTKMILKELTGSSVLWLKTGSRFIRSILIM